MRTELLIVLALVGWTCLVVLVCRFTRVNRRAGEEPVREDDPEWCWPVGSREARLDDAVRELGAS